MEQKNIKLKGIFYNSRKALCSIWESGKMVYDALCKSNEYTINYSEETHIDYGYDFYVFNHHVNVNNWMNKSIIGSIKNKFCVVTEVCHKDNPIGGIPNYFDYYIVLDPTIVDKNNVFGFPRPLEDHPVSTYIDMGFPIIGSFGFNTPNKEWHKIVQGVNNEFDEALIRINIPSATYVPTNKKDIEVLNRFCTKFINKKKIKLEMTSIYMDKSTLVKWCSENTLNCFLYNRTHTHPTGLSAVTDQAISSKRPLLVSSDPTFRHILKYIQPYPKTTFKESLLNKSQVERMYNDWSQENFYKKFEKILLSNK